MTKTDDTYHGAEPDEVHAIFRQLQTAEQKGIVLASIWVTPERMKKLLGRSSFTAIEIAGVPVRAIAIVEVPNWRKGK